jgi:transcriptional regulator with XRE-family HTH domain
VDSGAFLKKVGANLRRARWLAGLTQEQVGGLSLRYYQDLERGLRNPTLEMLLLLAQQFAVTVADLVNVPGARPAEVRLEDREAAAPPPGRKPRTHPRSR